MPDFSLTSLTYASNSSAGMLQAGAFQKISFSRGSNLNTNFSFWGCVASKFTAVWMVRICGLTRTVSYKSKWFISFCYSCAWIVPSSVRGASRRSSDHLACLNCSSNSFSLYFLFWKESNKALRATLPVDSPWRISKNCDFAVSELLSSKLPFCAKKRSVFSYVCCFYIFINY